LIPCVFVAAVGHPDPEAADGHAVAGLSGHVDDRIHHHRRPVEDVAEHVQPRVPLPPVHHFHHQGGHVSHKEASENEEHHEGQFPFTSSETLWSDPALQLSVQHLDFDKDGDVGDSENDQGQGHAQHHQGLLDGVSVVVVDNGARSGDALQSIAAVHPSQ